MPSAKRGFTLIEIAVSALIFGIVAILFAGIYGQIQKASHFNKENRELVLIADDMINNMRKSAKVQLGNPANPVFPSYYKFANEPNIAATLDADGNIASYELSSTVINYVYYDGAATTQKEKKIRKTLDIVYNARGFAEIDLTVSDYATGNIRHRVRTSIHRTVVEDKRDTVDMQRIIGTISFEGMSAPPYPDGKCLVTSSGSTPPEYASWDTLTGEYTTRKVLYTGDSPYTLEILPDNNNPSYERFWPKHYNDNTQNITITNAGPYNADTQTLQRVKKGTLKVNVIDKNTGQGINGATVVFNYSVADSFPIHLNKTTEFHAGQNGIAVLENLYVPKPQKEQLQWTYSVPNDVILQVSASDYFPEFVTTVTVNDGMPATELTVELTRQTYTYIKILVRHSGNSIIDNDTFFVGLPEIVSFNIQTPSPPQEAHCLAQILLPKGQDYKVYYLNSGEIKKEHFVRLNLNSTDPATVAVTLPVGVTDTDPQLGKKKRYLRECDANNVPNEQIFTYNMSKAAYTWSISAPYSLYKVNQNAAGDYVWDQTHFIMPVYSPPYAATDNDLSIYFRNNHFISTYIYYPDMDGNLIPVNCQIHPNSLTDSTLTNNPSICFIGESPNYDKNIFTTFVFGAPNVASSSSFIDNYYYLSRARAEFSLDAGNIGQCKIGMTPKLNGTLLTRYTDGTGGPLTRNRIIETTTDTGYDCNISISLNNPNPDVSPNTAKTLMSVGSSETFLATVTLTKLTDGSSITPASTDLHYRWELSNYSFATVTQNSTNPNQATVSINSGQNFASKRINAFYVRCWVCYKGKRLANSYRWINIDSTANEFAISIDPAPPTSLALADNIDIKAQITYLPTSTVLQPHINSYWEWSLSDYSFGSFAGAQNNDAVTFVGTNTGSTELRLRVRTHAPLPLRDFVFYVGNPGFYKIDVTAGGNK